MFWELMNSTCECEESDMKVSPALLLFASPLYFLKLSASGRLFISLNIKNVYWLFGAALTSPTPALLV